MGFDYAIPFVFGASAVALAFAAWLVLWILRQDPGSARMQEIAEAIRTGAEAYLNRQYRTISIIAIIFAAILAVGITDPSNPWLGAQTAGGFLLGALCSTLAGYVAMYISVRSNVRTANAVLSGLDRALKIAFRGGMVFGLAVVAMSLLGISALYMIFGDPRLSVGFGFGASFSALFA